MVDKEKTSQEERVLAFVAHGSILLGVFTNGIGGIGASLAIWLMQRNKSAYAAGQALQALVYQVIVMVISLGLWFCWGFVWMLMILPPIIANPAAYETTPPPGLFAGLSLMICPLGITALTLLYGLWGAVRTLGGHDFRYAGIGNWLEQQR